MSDTTIPQDNGSEQAAAAMVDDLLGTEGATLPSMPIPVSDFKTPGTSPVIIPADTGTRSTRLPAPIEFSVPPNPNAKGFNADGNLEVTYYKHPIGSCRYIFKDGRAANFVNHIFATTDKAQIAELDQEAHHMGLLKAEGILDPLELTDPMVALRNKYFREFLALQAEERARANNPLNDAGNNIKEGGPRVNAAGTGYAVSGVEMMAAAAAAATPTAPGAAKFNLNPQQSTAMAGLRARLAGSK